MDGWMSTHDSTCMHTASEWERTELFLTLKSQLINQCGGSGAVGIQPFPSRRINIGWSKKHHKISMDAKFRVWKFDEVEYFQGFKTFPSQLLMSWKKRRIITLWRKCITLYYTLTGQSNVTSPIKGKRMGRASVCDTLRRTRYYLCSIPAMDTQPKYNPEGTPDKPSMRNILLEYTNMFYIKYKI